MAAPKKVKMQWHRLLTKERLYAKPYDPIKDFDAKTEYQKDIDRIIFSSPFRRLQDKTQVVPLPGNDFIRSRLTHSIEVSAVGRSLGKLAGQFIIKREQFHLKKELKNITPDDFASILIAACLAHDIGNPPFGHSGEKAIGQHFQTAINKDELQGITNLSESQKKDLSEFEGNAAGFRILTNDHPSGRAGGLRLTFATMGAFTKYPCSSDKSNFNKKNLSRKSLSKFGFFAEESKLFERIADKLGLIQLENTKDAKAWCRHPLSFLMEAADTLTYHLIDFEDACKLGVLDANDAIEMFEKIVNKSKDPRCKIKDWKAISGIDEQLGALRSKALNALVYECSLAFKQNYAKIMDGTFDKELVEVIPSWNILEQIFTDHFQEKYYTHTSVLDTEIAGHEVINFILALLLDCIRNPKNIRNKKLLLKLPIQFSSHLESTEISLYKKLLICSDFVSRMTDTYALAFYRRLRGIA